MNKENVSIPILIEHARDFRDYGLVIEAGYAQAACNDEGLVDFGDAIRIAMESHFEGSLWLMSSASRDLLGTLIHVRCATQWATEFPEGRAQ